MSHTLHTPPSAIPPPCVTPNTHNRAFSLHWGLLWWRSHVSLYLYIYIYDIIGLFCRSFLTYKDRVSFGIYKSLLWVSFDMDQQRCTTSLCPSGLWWRVLVFLIDLFYRSLLECISFFYEFLLMWISSGMYHVTLSIGPLVALIGVFYTSFL